jgi:hypothetical protein
MLRMANGRINRGRSLALEGQSASLAIAVPPSGIPPKTPEGAASGG